MEDSEVVFRKLTECYEKLGKTRNSPAKITDYFRDFVYYTTELTDITVHEFKEKTGVAWNWKTDFKGWNAVSDLCRELRNSQHDVVIRMKTTQNRSVPLNDLLGEPSATGRHLTVSAESTQSDPFAEEIPCGIEVFPADPETGEIMLTKPLQGRLETYFRIVPRRSKTQRHLENAGIDDVHQICEVCYKTLAKYYEHYQQKLAEELG